MASQKYLALKSFVSTHGGARLSVHPTIRDRLVEMAVEEYPCDAEPDRQEEVLRARLRRRIRGEYGSVVAILLISVFASLISRIIVEWWKAHHSHKVLMYGWQQRAAKS